MNAVEAPVPLGPQASLHLVRNEHPPLSLGQTSCTEVRHIRLRHFQ